MHTYMHACMHTYIHTCIPALEKRRLTKDSGRRAPAPGASVVGSMSVHYQVSFAI